MGQVSALLLLEVAPSPNFPRPRERTYRPKPAPLLSVLPEHPLQVKLLRGSSTEHTFTIHRLLPPLPPPRQVFHFLLFPTQGARRNSSSVPQQATQTWAT